MLAYPQHSFPQSIPVNIGILQSNVKLDIGKGLLSIFEERYNAVFPRMATLQCGGLLGQQVCKVLVFHFFFNVVVGRHVVIFLIETFQLCGFSFSNDLLSGLSGKVLILLPQSLQGIDEFLDFRFERSIVVPKLINVVVQPRRLGEDMLSLVILFSQVQAELLHEIQHEGMVLAYPGGPAVHRAILRLLQPLEIGLGAILGRLPQSQRADAAADPI